MWSFKKYLDFLCTFYETYKPSEACLGENKLDNIMVWNNFICYNQILDPNLIISKILYAIHYKLWY